ncbi:MAG: oxidoreductase [Acidimicrobiaceae bacterium]|nr:oxidoreductase [Acidimicrobiaceae bacterium]HAB58287.1 oxidoreductase [Acidimicrobiaceae bacterium]
MENPKTYKWVGTRPIRHDGYDKVVGKARFAADLNLPSQLHAAYLRSPHAHANIVSIDTSRAEAMPGVKAVVTGGDFPALDITDPNHDVSINVLARGTVLYHGHAIAAVAATTKAEAQAAAAAIEVEYELLPFVLGIDEAMADGAPLANEQNYQKFIGPSDPSNIATHTPLERGDADAAMVAADIVIDREFDCAHVHQGYIEPHACVVDTGADGKANVWASSQGHFMVRAITAAVLGWETSRIKVTPAEIGGGFGGKTTVYLEPVAARLSEKAGRPVKLVMSREEVLRSSGPAPGAKLRIKIGATSDGELTAIDGWMAYQVGAYGDFAGMVGAMSVASYKFPNLKLESWGVLSNTPKTAAYRAPSAPHAAFAIESVIDDIASELGMDPIELRLKNAAVEGDLTAMGMPHPRIGLVECLEALKASDHYQSEPAEGAARGVAVGFWFNIGEQSSATVNLNEDGTATVITGSPDIGGSRASMALMAAEELGIDVYSITPVVADTEAVGFTDVTEGSRATFATGKAVVEACRELKVELCRRAAQTMGVDEAEVEWVDGAAVSSSHGGEPLTLAAITAQAKRTGGPLTATASLNAAGAGPSFAVHCADVKVDEETGQTAIIRYTAVQDAGTAIHPSYVEGQMQGGSVQGIGWALNEEYIFSSDGVLMNPGFLDYRIPVASDLPMIETIIVEVPNPSHPYGVRGVGETGIVPPMATIGNAIKAATGVRMSSLPMSPPKVLKALGDAR